LLIEGALRALLLFAFFLEAFGLFAALAFGQIARLALGFARLAFGFARLAFGFGARDALRLGTFQLGAFAREALELETLAQFLFDPVAFGLLAALALRALGSDALALDAFGKLAFRTRGELAFGPLGFHALAFRLGALPFGFFALGALALDAQTLDAFGFDALGFGAARALLRLTLVGLDQCGQHALLFVTLARDRLFARTQFADALFHFAARARTGCAETFDRRAVVARDALLLCVEAADVFLRGCDGRLGFFGDAAQRRDAFVEAALRVGRLRDDLAFRADVSFELHALAGEPVFFLAFAASARFGRGRLVRRAFLDDAFAFGTGFVAGTFGFASRGRRKCGSGGEALRALLGVGAAFAHHRLRFDQIFEVALDVVALGCGFETAARARALFARCGFRFAQVGVRAFEFGARFLDCSDVDRTLFDGTTMRGAQLPELLLDRRDIIAFNHQ
jgi:hypothetical protein